MNYLAKMQLKSSKAVLVLRHRAMPHNVLRQATRLHRGTDRSCHKLPTFRETSFCRKSRIILRMAHRLHDNIREIFTRQIAPDHQYTWALIYVLFTNDVVHPFLNPWRWNYMEFRRIYCFWILNFKIIYGWQTVQTNNPRNWTSLYNKRVCNTKNYTN